MRRIAIVAAVLAPLAGSGLATPPARASCIFVVVWHDRAYFAVGSPGTLPDPGAPVRGAVEPGCNDTGGGITEPPTPVAARRIAGVSPNLALLVRDTVLVGNGYLTQVTGFPGNATRPSNETRGCTLGGRVRITGPAQVAFGFLSVHVADSTVRLHHLLRGAAHVFVDGATRIDGLVRHGQPYIGVGQLVRVDARFCKVPGSIGTKIVARRIVPAGPVVAPSTAEDVLGANWRRSPSDAVVAPHGYGWRAAAVLVVLSAATVTAVVLARRRSRSSGTG